MRSKLKIMIPIAIAVIAVIIAVVFINFSPKESVDISSLMSTAQKYLVDNQYEQAIAEFKKVIDLDPMNADAYLGLADAYIGIGDTDSAVEILEKGYELTGDERLKKMLDELTGGSAEAEVTETTATSALIDTQIETTTTATTSVTADTTDAITTTTTSISVVDDSGKCGDNAVWSLRNGILTISGTGDVYSPASPLDVDTPWYDYSSEINSVIIESGITSICRYAFFTAQD